jgi:tripartite-type tricarboxylate transporter receptor subunit TctC
VIVTFRNLAKRCAVVSGAVLVATTLSTASVVSASTKTCHSANGFKVSGVTAKATCAGLAFYAGKTITFVAADNVGGGFDQNARAYAPYLSKYLGANVNVINIPAGNTVAGMNFVAGTNNSNPGLTVGWLNIGPIVEDKVLGIAGVQFNAAGEAMLGGTAPNYTITVAYKSAACASWDSGFAGLLANNSATNVVTEPIQTTGSTTFNELMLNGIFGIHYKAIPGYASTTQVVQGWARGDGCIITTPLSNAGPFLAAGTAVALISNVAVPSTTAFSQYLTGVPTYAQAEKTYAKYIVGKTSKAAVIPLNEAGQTVRVFFVPPKTPQTEQAALRAAFKWAGLNTNLHNYLASLGSPYGYTDPKTAKTGYLKYLAYTYKVKPFLAAIGG